MPSRSRPDAAATSGPPRRGATRQQDRCFPSGVPACGGAKRAAGPGVRVAASGVVAIGVVACMGAVARGVARPRVGVEGRLALLT